MEVGITVPELWGVINLTPDSFYPASRAAIGEAVERAKQMLEDGATVIDVGAESTRPGAEPVAPVAQLDQLIPFVQGLADTLGAPVLKKVSVDTRDAGVMERMADIGVGFINDVSGGSDEVFALVARKGIRYVLMHTQGTPRDMQLSPHYEDVVAEVETFLLTRSGMLEGAGASRDTIIWDTGIGFGKNVDHNLQLIAAHGRLRTHGYRLLAGVSRKSFIGRILGREKPEDRLSGSLAVQVYLTLRGCDILRVHDVKEMADSLRMIAAIQQHEL